MIRTNTLKGLTRLVGIREASHTRHNTENVVVGSIDVDGGGGGGTDGVVADSE